VNPTNKPLVITLKGKQHKLFFDLNTFSAFEEVTGKFFLDYIGDLQEAVKATVEEDSKDPLGVFRRISMKDFRAFLWAALHYYGPDDEPIWPYKLHQLGKLVDVDTMARLVPQVLTGSAENLPNAEEMDAPQESSSDRPPQPEAPKPAPENGGEVFGPSDAEVLGSLETSSED